MTLSPPPPPPPGPPRSFDYDITTAPMNLLTPQSAAARTTVLGLMWVAFFTTLKMPGAILAAIVMTTFCGIGSTPRVTDLSNWEQPGGPPNFLPDTPVSAGAGRPRPPASARLPPALCPSHHCPPPHPTPPALQLYNQFAGHFDFSPASTPRLCVLPGWGPMVGGGMRGGGSDLRVAPA